MNHIRHWNQDIATKTSCIDLRGKTNFKSRITNCMLVAKIVAFLTESPKNKIKSTPLGDQCGCIVCTVHKASFLLNNSYTYIITMSQLGKKCTCD